MAALRLAVPALLLAACSCQDESQAAFTSSCGWTIPEDGETRDRLWPVGSGTDPCRLLTTYGQAVGSRANKLHLGLDVLAQAGENVYALEDGVVERVEVGGPSEYDYGLVVASKPRADRPFPGPRSFLYMHMVPAEVFVVGQEIQVNQLLGTVAPDDQAHVHLSRLEGDSTAQEWGKIDALSVRNPLALLDPEVLGDETDPEIEWIESEPLAFRSNEIPNNSAVTRIHKDDLEAGAIDVIACVRDLDGRSGTLAPYVLTLSVGGRLQSRLVLDGKLGSVQSGDVYSRDGTLSTVGADASDPCVLYFELTNGSPMGVPSATHAWDATVGEHLLEVCVQDVKGRVKRAPMSVSVTVRP